MKTFKVPAYSESICWITVNAETPEQAEEIAAGIDGGAFSSEECFDWRIGNAAEEEYDPSINNDSYAKL